MIFHRDENEIYSGLGDYYIYEIAESDDRDVFDFELKFITNHDCNFSATTSFGNKSNGKYYTILFLIIKKFNALPVLGDFFVLYVMLFLIVTFAIIIIICYISIPKISMIVCKFTRHIRIRNSLR